MAVRRCTRQLLPLARLILLDSQSLHGSATQVHLRSAQIVRQHCLAPSDPGRNHTCCCLTAGLLLVVEHSYGPSYGAAPTAPYLPTR
jgi:hypothetical protein